MNRRKVMGLRFEVQKPLVVNYKRRTVGEIRADIIVEEKVLIEIKAVSALLPVHEAQLLNYLRATGIKVGLLVNFGEKLEFKRRVF
ncbi:GxxExxY protein [bacterium]|nr:GxxExxY protein [bacterium]